MLRAASQANGSRGLLDDVIKSSRRAIATLGVASGVINVLTLTGSLFMMQVYDRVLGSQSVPTLVGLSVLTAFAYVFQGWLELMRGRILTLLGEKVDNDLAPKVQEAGLKLALSSPTGQGEANQALRDVESIRGFIASNGLVTAFDLPWMPLYLVLLTLLHPYFGLATLVSAGFLIGLTWKTERGSQAAVKRAFEQGIKRNQAVDAGIRSAEAIAANGMRKAMARRWNETHTNYLQAQRESTFVIGGYGAVARTARMVVQSMMLGIGAYLAIQGQLTGGAIIAASIIASRALAPIDQAIASWRPFTAARDGYRRLSQLLSRVKSEPERFRLDPPSKSLVVEQVAVAPPGAQRPSVHGVSFTLKAGQGLGIVGSSASGKSSLVRAIVNAWIPASGRVRVDEASLDQWDPDELGRHLGYLPQDFQLFEGTVAENIARFDPNSTEEAVQKAARAAGLDDYVRRVLGGYDRPIGAGGAFLSAGQRQRIGLARALYGDPFIVVLDEPNSNLDQEGEQALLLAMRAVRQRGGIVIVVAHRQHVLQEVDMVLALSNGTTAAYGTREEVAKKLQELQRAGQRAQQGHAGNGHSVQAPPQKADNDATVPPPPDTQPEPKTWSTLPASLVKSTETRGR